MAHAFKNWLGDYIIFYITVWLCRLHKHSKHLVSSAWFAVEVESADTHKRHYVAYASTTYGVVTISCQLISCRDRLIHFITLLCPTYWMHVAQQKSVELATLIETTAIFGEWRTETGAIQERTQGGGGHEDLGGCMIVHNWQYYSVRRGHPECWK